VLKSLVFLALAGFSFLASAATAPYTATISWTNPTLDVNNAALPAGSLTSNTLYRGTKSDGSDLAKLKTMTPAAVSTTDAALTAGTWCYAISASNAAGESAKSAVACITVTLPPVPKPPSNFTPK
jgi:hypothetical protein